MNAALTILPDPPPPPTPIGLIAGGGRLPVLIARNLRKAGHEIHGLGLCGQYDRELPRLCTTFREVPLLRIGTWCAVLKRHEVHHAIMVGKVDKAELMHDPWRLVRNIPDTTTLRGWYRHLRHDRRSHAILAAIGEELDRNGICLMDSTSPIPDQLATPGVMTRTVPSKQQRADVEFVWPMLAELLRLDVGQALAVRELDVIAVEAVEGTDRMIQRAGELCRAKGWTLCKGSRAGHDRRSDVPTVGMTTLDRLHAAGGRCLALASGDVIMIDREKMIERADQLGIAVVGVPVSHAAPKTGEASIEDANPAVSVRAASGITSPAEALSIRREQ